MNISIINGEAIIKNSGVKREDLVGCDMVELMYMSYRLDAKVRELTGKDLGFIDSLEIINEDTLKLKYKPEANGHGIRLIDGNSNGRIPLSREYMKMYKNPIDSLLSELFDGMFGTPLSENTKPYSTDEEKEVLILKFNDFETMYTVYKLNDKKSKVYTFKDSLYLVIENPTKKMKALYGEFGGIKVESNTEFFISYLEEHGKEITQGKNLVEIFN